MRNVTDEFVKFALEYADYDKIPAEVIHESKRVLLDGLGNALGGIASDKGKIGIMFARRQGGNGAASLIGVGGKSSAAVAAFCNAELWNGLDMDPVPHVPPIVIPAILAVAEERGSTGKVLNGHAACMAPTPRQGTAAKCPYGSGPLPSLQG